MSDIVKTQYMENPTKGYSEYIAKDDAAREVIKPVPGDRCLMKDGRLFFCWKAGTWEEMSNGGGGGTSAQVQSDWNQNDVTSGDYVKNRPFYEEITTEEKEQKSYDWVIPETFENVEKDEAGNRYVKVHIDYSLGLREGQPYLISFTQLPSEEEFCLVEIADYDKTMSVPFLHSFGSSFALYDGVKRYSDTEYEFGNFATLIVYLNTDIDPATIKDRKITFCKLPNKKVNLVSVGMGDAGSLALQEDWTYTVSLLKNNVVVASFTKTPRVVVDGNPYSDSGRVLYLTAGSEGTSLNDDNLGFGFSDKIWSDLDATHSSASYLWDGTIDADAISIMGHSKATVVTERKIHKISEKFLPESVPTANEMNQAIQEALYVNTEEVIA